MENTMPITRDYGTIYREDGLGAYLHAALEDAFWNSVVFVLQILGETVQMIAADRFTSFIVATVAAILISCAIIKVWKPKITTTFR